MFSRREILTGATGLALSESVFSRPALAQNAPAKLIPLKDRKSTRLNSSH